MFAFIDGDGNIVYEKVGEDSDEEMTRPTPPKVKEESKDQKKVKVAGILGDSSSSEDEEGMSMRKPRDSLSNMMDLLDMPES